MRSGLNNERLEILNCLDNTYASDLRRDVFTGLTAKEKKLQSKYFYDARGSYLFQQICRQPEYYQTRTEMAILRKAASDIMEGVCDADLIELGSGSNWKIRELLDTLDRSCLARVRYVPVDVSESALMGASEELLGLYPELNILCILADFTKQIAFLPANKAKLISFFGSTIGNFSDEGSRRFMGNIARSMQTGDRFILGVDMIKQREILEKAYNDAEGITAEFNRNILLVINRELNADFDITLFDHKAFFNEVEGRVEMHLMANRDLKVNIAGLDLTVSMHKGETIRTEICRKFSVEKLEAMVDGAGMKIIRVFSDPMGWFSLVETVLKPSHSSGQTPGKQIFINEKVNR